MADAIDTVYAHEIMTRGVVTVGPETPLDEIARLLVQRQITGVPVVDAYGRVLGIVSEFDLIAKRGRVAADVMSTDVLAVSEDTPAETIADLIARQRVRRVPVLRDGRLVGIVTRADLVRLFAMTRWTCTQCGYFERGFLRPEACEGCGSREFELQREPPGM